MLDEGGALKCADTESPWKSSLSLSESNQIPQRCAVFPSHFSTHSPSCLVMFPMEHRQALEQEAGRTGTYKTQTSFLSLTEA